LSRKVALQNGARTLFRQRGALKRSSKVQTHTGSSNATVELLVVLAVLALALVLVPVSLWGDHCSLSTAGVCRNAAANHRC